MSILKNSSSEFCYNQTKLFYLIIKFKIILLFFLISKSAYTQSSFSLIPTLPTSPSSVKMTNISDSEFDPSTGIPRISIPLYELNHWGYKIPVSLNYYPSPFKAGYNFDVLGYGWSLSVNGHISRTVKYNPDEWSDFELTQPSTGYLNNCTNCITNGNYAHDKFEVSLPNGNSFDFIIDKQNGQRVYIVSNDRNVKINLSISNNQIISIALVDEDGVNYTFDSGDMPAVGTSNFNSYVSWKLTRIDLPNSPEPIIFSYPYEISTPNYTSCNEPVIEFKHYHEPGILGVNPNVYQARKYNEGFSVSYRMKLLGEIKYGPNGKSKLQLNYKNNFNSPYNYLEKIILKDDNRVISDVRLNLTMLNLNGLCTVPIARLDSVGFYGTTGIKAEYFYKLEYESNIFNFNNTDHWGNLNYSSYDRMPNFNFFTEWHSNTITELHNAGMVEVNKLPTENSPLRKFSLSNHTYSNSKNASSPSYHGVLKKIIFPTSGYRTFEFENHKFYTHTTPNGDYIHSRENRHIIEGGGFRIRTIQDYDSVENKIRTKKFRYGKTNLERGILAYPHIHNGAGEPVVDPNILTYMNFSTHLVNHPIKNMILGVDAYNPFNDIYYQNNSWYWLCNFSALNFRNLLGGRRAVLYESVSVYEGDINPDLGIFPKGKTVYEYDIKGDYPGEYTFEPSQYYGNMLGYVSKEYKYDKLKSMIEYSYDIVSSSFIKQRSENYNWTWSIRSYFDWQFKNTYPENKRPSWITVGSLFVGKPYWIGSGRLNNKNVIEYHDSDSITYNESYLYNDRGQKNQIFKQGSINEIISNKIEYPISSTQGTTPPIIQSMLNRNIISPVLSDLTFMPEFNQRQYEQRSGSKIEYSVFNTNQILPSKIYMLEFGPTTEEYVLRKEVIKYSLNGNPQEVLENGNLYKSYLWGYDDRYITAEVQNATLSDVAYTSFECNNKGGWIYSGSPSNLNSHTGEFGYHLTSNTSISRSGLITNKKYQVILYVHGNSVPVISGATILSSINEYLSDNWKLYKYIITNSNILTISTNSSNPMWVDDLRIHPIGSKMTTFTYLPLIGLTSKTDNRGVTEYYGYDTLGRLQYSLDSKRNLLKNYQYNFRK